MEGKWNCLEQAGRVRAAMVIAAALTCAPPALADGPQVTFRGHITLMQGNTLPAPWNSVQSGDAWQMSLCFEPQTPSVCDATTIGCYPAVHTARLQVGSTVVTQSGPGTGQIEVVYDGVHRSAYHLTVNIGPAVAATVNLVGAPNVLAGIDLLPCDRMPPLDTWTGAEFLLESTIALPGLAAGRVGFQSCDHVIGCLPCPRGCIGDYDGVNGVDGDDVIAFFADWDANLPCADVNHSGGVDGDDVIRFFRAWDSGRCCPPPPDHNGDGMITREDYCEFHSDFGAGYACADANDDGQIDLLDLAAFDAMYEQAGGPGLPTGADFNRDGHVTLCDQQGFAAAFGAGQLSADMDGDCALTVDDFGLFAAAYAGAAPTDWNGDGRVDCGDPRAFRASVRAAESSADFDCDGDVGAADVLAFMAEFAAVYSGPRCPGGADFNLDGRINCEDIGDFVSAYNANDSRADYDGDGAFTAGDLGVFATMYLDWDRDGNLACDDSCAYIADFTAMNPGADMDCNGTVDIDDAVLYFNFFGQFYEGPLCPAC